LNSDQQQTLHVDKNKPFLDQFACGARQICIASGGCVD
jgi:hypothetical protein